MTQSLSNLMKEGSAALLILVGLLLLLCFFWRWYRQGLAQKQSLPEGENHPAIPTKFYKLSELQQAAIDLLNRPVRARAAGTADAHHIPPDLWDV